MATLSTTRGFPTSILRAITISWTIRARSPPTDPLPLGCDRGRDVRAYSRVPARTLRATCQGSSRASYPFQASACDPSPDHTKGKWSCTAGNYQCGLRHLHPSSYSITSGGSACQCRQYFPSSSALRPYGARFQKRHDYPRSTEIRIRHEAGKLFSNRASFRTCKRSWLPLSSRSIPLLANSRQSCAIRSSSPGGPRLRRVTSVRWP